MGTRIGSTLFVIIIVSCVFSCMKDEDVSPAGHFLYQGFDSASQEVANGQMTLVLEDSRISGRKDITGEAMESGKSRVEGWVDEDETIHIRLTFNKGPNILITGRYENGWLRGQRILESLAGRQAAGTFDARRTDGIEAYCRIAWAYIDGDHDDTIIGRMNDGIVRTDHYGDTATISVTWHTTQDALLGPITVHIDPFTMEVIGINPRF